MRCFMRELFLIIKTTNYKTRHNVICGYRIYNSHSHKVFFSLTVTNMGNVYNDNTTVQQD